MSPLSHTLLLLTVHLLLAGILLGGFLCLLLQWSDIQEFYLARASVGLVLLLLAWVGTGAAAVGGGGRSSLAGGGRWAGPGWRPAADGHNRRGAGSQLAMLSGNPEAFFFQRMNMLV